MYIDIIVYVVELHRIRRIHVQAVQAYYVVHTAIEQASTYDIPHCETLKSAWDFPGSINLIV